MTSAHFRRWQHAMLRKVVAFFLAFTASLAAAEQAPLPSQSAESSAAHTTADTRTGSPGTASPKPQPVAMPGSSGADATAEVENLRRFNELRREILDHRAKTVDWWLAAMAIFLTLLGIVAVIAGYLSFKRFREIEIEARENVELSGEHAKEARGLVDEIKARRDEAESIVKGLTAADVHDNPDEARRATDRVQENPTASPIDQAIAVAVLLQRQGNIEESIEKWRAVAVITEGTDDDLSARSWFSVGYLRQEHMEHALEAAIHAYNESVRLKPNFAEAYNNRGNAKHFLGNHEEAIADYDEAIRLKPNLSETYNNRGNAKNFLGRHEGALADYDEAIRQRPDSPTTHNNRGNVKSNLGRHADAIADYDEAIRQKPDYPDAYNNRGLAKDRLGNHEEAISDYNEAIRLKPDNLQAYYNRGNTKGNLGRHGEAIADYDEAIRLKPDLAEAYYNRGKANLSLNRVDEARRDFEAAIPLARGAGDETLANDAERALKELLGGQAP